MLSSSKMAYKTPHPFWVFLASVLKSNAAGEPGRAPTSRRCSILQDEKVQLDEIIEANGHRVCAVGGMSFTLFSLLDVAKEKEADKKAEEAERGFGMARNGEGASKLRQTQLSPSSIRVLCESDQRVTIAGAGLIPWC
jgi:hypothetical protein